MIRCLRAVFAWFSRFRPIRAMYLRKERRRTVTFVPMTAEQAALFISGQNGRLRRAMGSLYKRIEW